ncbi:MAG TPA: hypothetical protein DCZ88_15085 [Pseudanabaena sp.]|nr:hypothetical protein [Pseudanabaena sp.]
MVTRNSKLILGAMGLMLGIGSIVGYFLARWDLQSNAIATSPSTVTETASKPTPRPIKPSPAIPPRTELETKYRLCTNTQVTNKALSRFDDKQLNDLVFKVCTENS